MLEFYVIFWTAGCYFYWVPPLCTCLNFGDIRNMRFITMYCQRYSVNTIQLLGCITLYMVCFHFRQKKVCWMIAYMDNHRFTPNTFAKMFLHVFILVSQPFLRIIECCEYFYVNLGDLRLLHKYVKTFKAENTSTFK